MESKSCVNLDAITFWKKECNATQYLRIFSRAAGTAIDRVDMYSERCDYSMNLHLLFRFSCKGEPVWQLQFVGSNSYQILDNIVGALADALLSDANKAPRAEKYFIRKELGL